MTLAPSSIVLSACVSVLCLAFPLLKIIRNYYIQHLYEQILEHFLDKDLQKTVKIGGVYSADGHIVVQEGRGNHNAHRGNNNGHGIFGHYLHQHHHHHHKKQSNQQRRGTHDCAGNGRAFGKQCEPHHWQERKNDPRAHLKRQELIPRARLRQRSPDYRSIPLPEKPIRHSVSCCGKRNNKPEIERTRSDTGHYTRPVYVEEKRNSDDIERGYVKYERSSPESEEYGYCTLKRSEKRSDKRSEKISERQQEEESDMEYYTSSETTSQETVKYNGKKEHQGNNIRSCKEVSHDSNESGFDERRDSSSSQEQLDKTDQLITPKYTENTKMDKELEIEIKEESNIPLPPTMPPPLPPSQVKETKDKNDNTIRTDGLHLKMTDVEMKNEIRKFIERKENNARLYDSAQNIANATAQFYEEEFSYEPELKRTSSKLVLRTRSLLNLDEENNQNNKTYIVRPMAVRTKITTGPDGTFVIAGRKATSELNLSDNSANSSNSSSPKAIRPSGEDLKRRKEEIFKQKEEPKLNTNKYYEEINKDNTETTKQMAINNLKKYLKENKIGLRELLTNKNVVIIEPYRGEKPVDLSEYNHRNAEFDKGCRITGATVKPSVGETTGNESNTLPRASKPHQPNIQRHYFYHLIKTKGDLKDDELPDPDKVRNTRQMFQKEVKLTGPEDKEIMLPIAAKIVNPTSKDSKPRLTPEVRIIDDGKRRSPKNLNKKWTDTGSLSSGVSSDMSCFENELDNNLDEISHKGYSSDDELEVETFREITEIHPVSPEVMKKIRACGTTVTYYGGRVISHSHGPVRSPMTMTIMDEIRQGHENSRRSRDQYLGIKFRLVKSNSCGSRLELAGTDEPHNELSKNRYYEDMYGKSLSEELAECRGRMEPIEDVEDDNVKLNQPLPLAQNQFKEDQKPIIQSWRALIESRKQIKAMEHRRHGPDMVFEEFQVAGN